MELGEGISIDIPDFLAELVELLTEDNWVELEYLHADGTGVAGADYTVWDALSGDEVASGKLDGNGFAKVDLPSGVSNVQYRFSKQAKETEVFKQPAANPEYEKEWLDAVLEKSADGLEEALFFSWAVIQGDFNENMTVGQIVTNTAITMIPYVDQAADVRDLTANFKLLIFDERYDDKWVWFALVLTMIGCIPLVGSFAKGIGKVVQRAIKLGKRAELEKLFKVFNYFGKGNAKKELQDLAEKLPKHADEIKQSLKDIFQQSRQTLRTAARYLPSSSKAQMDEAIESLNKAEDMVDSQVDDVIKEVTDGIDDALKAGIKSAKTGGTKTKHTVKQVAEPPPKLLEAAGEGGKIPWNSWRGYKKVTVNGQEYAQVGNRLYTRHAVDRMQPSGLRASRYQGSVGSTGGMPQIRQAGGGYDYGRAVAPEYVEATISSSRGIVQANGNISHTSGSLQVILNPQGAVVTIITL